MNLDLRALFNVRTPSTQLKGNNLVKRHNLKGHADQNNTPFVNMSTDLPAFTLVQVISQTFTKREVLSSRIKG